MADASHPLWQLTRARLVEFYRDPGVIFWVFGLPLLLAVALGLAFRNRPPDPVRVVVVDAALAGVLTSERGFQTTITSLDDARMLLRRGAVDVLVTKHLLPAGGNGYTFRFDDTRPEARVARLAVADALERARGRNHFVPTVDEKVVEPGSRYIDFLVPGLIGMNILGSSMWGVGYAIVDARKRKLLKRFAATPMKRSHYLLSMMLSRLVFLVAEVVALVLIGKLAFGVDVQGSYTAVAVLSLCGGVSFTGLSLLISARTESTEVASGLLNFAMLPMYLLSGSFFSAERFPDVIQPFVQALPLTAMNDGLRAVMNEGATLASQWDEVAILLAWGVLPFAIALRTFRWK